MFGDVRVAPLFVFYVVLCCVVLYSVLIFSFICFYGVEANLCRFLYWFFPHIYIVIGDQIINPLTGFT